MEAGNFLTTRQVAEQLCISVRTAQRLVKDKKITATKIGKEWRIPASEVQRLIQNGMNTP